MSIINYGELEEPILKIESILKSFDMEEKELILKQINARFVDKKNQNKIQDNLSNMKFGGLISKLIKTQTEGKKEGDDE